MVSLENVKDSLLKYPSSPTKSDPSALVRVPSTYHPLSTFALPKERSYRQQYGDMYFLRLTRIRPAVERAAEAAWADAVVGGERAHRVDRVLDVRQGEFCWITGTVYMEMKLKPDVLDDVTKDRWLAAPVTTQKYWSDDGTDKIALEDDSGRVVLVGAVLATVPLVTGVIIAVLGAENANGEFDVVDIKFADLPPQPERWTLASRPQSSGGNVDVDVDMTGTSSTSTPSKKIAFVSGLSFSSCDASCVVEQNLLIEFLLGEALTPLAQTDIAQISRLVILGDSIAPPSEKINAFTTKDADTRRTKKYGYDANTYNPTPSKLLDDWLAHILPAMPVTLLPGENDPANTSYPQQPIHRAMFPRSRAFVRGPVPSQQRAESAAADDDDKASTNVKSQPPPDDSSESTPWFHAATNPWEAEVEGWRVLATGGQNVSDVFKYVRSTDRLAMMEAMCRWRCCAPTAPDTLWTYPFQDRDPFVMEECPHLYVVGCQPRFSTRTIDGPDGQQVRLVTVPSFAETKELVLVDVDTLHVSRVRFAVTKKR